MSSLPGDKPLLWIGSSLKDLRGFPEEVKDEIEFRSLPSTEGIDAPIRETADEITTSLIELAARVVACIALSIPANTFATRSFAPTLRKRLLRA